MFVWGELNEIKIQSGVKRYSYILNIFTAGVPLAISALVAKYLVKDDYKTAHSSGSICCAVPY